MLVQIIIAGLPGSGKSTFAKTFGLPVFEADQYFMEYDAFTNSFRYKFEASKIREAHATCFKNVQNCLALGISCVVANTFTKRWEMARYLQLQADKINIYRCEGRFKNIHNVPGDIILKMKDGLEKIQGEMTLSHQELLSMSESNIKEILEKDKESNKPKKPKKKEVLSPIFRGF